MLAEVSFSVLEVEVANYYQINEELRRELTFHIADGLKFSNLEKENNVAGKCNVTLRRKIYKKSNNRFFLKIIRITLGAEKLITRHIFTD